MSYSIHINGGTRAKLKNTIRLHHIRMDEKTGEEAAKRSGSYINTALTHYNVVLVDEPNRMQEIRDKADAITKKRQAAGKRALRADAEIFGNATVQLSDDTLELMGWEFNQDGTKKPVSEQEDRIIKNVALVYRRLLYSMQQQPEMYGHIFCASIHFDESTPHMDILIDPLDVETETTLRDLKSGKNADGVLKLSAMQDNLGKYAGFEKMQAGNSNKNAVEAYDLRRGETRSEKKDLAVSSRHTKKQLKKDKKELYNVKKQVENAVFELDNLQRQINNLQDVAGETIANNKRSRKLLEENENRERELDAREQDIKKQLAQVAIEKQNVIMDQFRLKRMTQEELQKYTKKTDDAIRQNEEWLLQNGFTDAVNSIAQQTGIQL